MKELADVPGKYDMSSDGTTGRENQVISHLNIEKISGTGSYRKYYYQQAPSHAFIRSTYPERHKQEREKS
ncbi:hypothetical protein [Citrobacter koseri]|uniref:hypothetical protein n=1 Tax=Citrobacter koseri TaxID=545 RepID=UPI0023B133B3|nr:hypothetical protein [Citrobacter koseri]